MEATVSSISYGSAEAKQPVFDDLYLTRLRAGDEDTAKHFDRHFRRVLRSQLWGKFTQNRQDDLIDEVMTAAISKILRGQPREAGRLPAYIRGICSNLAKNSMRPSANFAEASLDFDRMATPGETAEERLIANERGEAAANVLRVLHPRDRDILLDLFYRDVPRDEVCAKHNVTREQLRLLLFRARQRFQECWVQSGNSLTRK
jgi:RNA polymerase sigma factor (sigma-70 family)